VSDGASDRRAREGDQVALLVAYDGGGLAGWQLQPDQPTGQGLLEQALARLYGLADTGGRVAVVGAGRTDAGVHALGQVAAYRAPAARGLEELELGLNALLPPSVRVLRAAVASPEFHPIRSALGKTYRYRIVNRQVVLPFESPWAWHVRTPLDVETMARAASRLRGLHDFASFVTAGGQSEATVRELRRLDVVVGRGGVVVVEAQADGFLYRMVRNLVGWLLEVGRGRQRPEAAGEVLEARDRSAAGPTAPAHGLCLVRVDYGDRGPWTGWEPDLEPSPGGW
jgi:tRNA pseudouridine38-40 synthase